MDKLKIAIGTGVLMVLGLLNIVSAYAADSRFGEMHTVEGIYTGILPVMIGVAAIIFIVVKVVSGLMGDSNILKF